jgi:adenine-specific DNA-methyltransferase
MFYPFIGKCMASNLLSQIEKNRLDLISKVDSSRKSANGQFMTPISISIAMADMFDTPEEKNIRLLDPGAGNGVLAFSFIEMLLKRDVHPESICVYAFEKDKFLAENLRKNASFATREFESRGFKIDFKVIEDDFIAKGSELLRPKLGISSPNFEPFTHIISNPPYLKISSSSEERKQLSEFGLQVNNLYSAFIGLSISLLANNGHLVAITPRSFCNGPYFAPFRKFLVNSCSFKQIHLFNSRDNAFHEDDVLQENVIYYLRKNEVRNPVTISVTDGRYFADSKSRKVAHKDIVSMNDPDRIIRIPANEFDDYVLERMSVLPSYLRDFGLEVSTGPVVDFRVKESIIEDVKDGSVPLIYPSHFKDQQIEWPISSGKKPNAIEVNEATSRWLFPNQHYVLIKRFSSKEERRRIYPAVFFPISDYESIGFENHLNLIHASQSGIEPEVAKGLASFLSSTIADLFFRQFSGHTQVNASDFRAFPFPNLDVIIELARFYVDGSIISQQVDKYLEKMFVSEYSINTPNPISLASH